MKKINLQKLAWIFPVILIFYSCSSTNYLTLSVTEPAPVFLSPEVKSIGILDRSLPSEENKGLDKLEQILSIEGKNLDKDGARAAIDGLKEELMQNPNLSSVKVITSTAVKHQPLPEFPSVLSWDQVTRDCKNNQVDALFVLSYYDTDTKINVATEPTEISGPGGIKIPSVITKATVQTNLKLGWRIYDPQYSVLRDEYWFRDNFSTSGEGINPMKAVTAVLGRKDRLNQLSRDIGRKYGTRILPYHTRVSRHYYVRGTDNFKIAKRRAQTGNWDGAAELWEKEIDHEKTKIAGRAHYNMAISNEINGNLEAAIEWASKAYSDYDDKKALQYINILKQRVRKNEELKQQTGN